MGGSIRYVSTDGLWKLCGGSIRYVSTDGLWRLCGREHTLCEYRWFVEAVWQGAYVM